MRGSFSRTLGAAWVLLSGGAWAHGRPPVPLDIHVTPDAGFIISGTFGLLLDQQDGGYGWVCSEAMGYGESYDPKLVRREDGVMLVASGRGLFRSLDHGCSWSPHGTPSLTGVADFVRTPGGSLLAVTNGNQSSRLYRSDDFGDTWRWVLERNDVQFTSVVAAPSRADTWYLGARRLSDGAGAVLEVEDGGGTVSEHWLHTDGGVGIARVLEVSAESPPTLAVSLSEPLSDVLVWMDDGGAKRVAESSAPWRTARFSPDSETLWAAGTGDVGLHRFAAGGAEPRRWPLPQAEACVAQGEDGTLYTCASDWLDGFSVGRIEPGDGGVTPLVGWKDVHGPWSCPVGTPTEQVCTALWPLFRLQLLGVGILDGGGGDGGVDAGMLEPPQSSQEGCGCGVSGAGALFPAVVVWLTRRRCPHRRSERS